MFGIVGGFLRGVLGAVLACVLLVVAVVAATNAVVVVQAGDDVVGAQEAGAVGADAIVVPGASVNADGSPSDILKARLDAAVELYFAGAADVIVMSGSADGDYYNEAQAMAAYAVEQGVASNDIVCDGEGYSTYESMERLASVYGFDSVVVVTQAYHLYRAVYDAQSVGLSVAGVVSDTGTYDDQLLFEAREVLARTKDFFTVLAGGNSVLVQRAADEMEDALS